MPWTARADRKRIEVMPIAIQESWFETPTMLHSAVSDGLRGEVVNDRRLRHTSAAKTTADRHR